MTLAYQDTFIPTSNEDVKPRDNVVVMSAYLYQDMLHNISHTNNASYLTNLQSWAEKCDNNNLQVWYYTLNKAFVSPMQTMYRIGEDFKSYYNERNVKGLFIEHESLLSGDMWDMVEWMEAKLMEDPNQDPDSLITDFTDGYYGEAGVYIRKYLSLIKTDLAQDDHSAIYNTDICDLKNISYDTVLEADQCFEEALAAVSDDVYTKRVKVARNSLDRYIVREFDSLSSTMLDRKNAAARLVTSYNTMIDQRCKKSTVPKYYVRTIEQSQLDYFELVAAADESAYVSGTAAFSDSQDNTFDKSDPEDVAVTITLNDARSITDIRKNGTTIKKNNYSVTWVSDTTKKILTIKKAYLATQETGELKLTVNFSKGDVAIFTINIKNTSKSSALQ